MAIERWGSLSATDHTGTAALIAKICFMATNQLARTQMSTPQLVVVAKSLAATSGLIRRLKDNSVTEQNEKRHHVSYIRDERQRLVESLY